MKTILPKRAEIKMPMALNDVHHDKLAADPKIPQFPQGSKYGSKTQPDVSSNGNSTFVPITTGGIDSSDNPGSPATVPTYNGTQPNLTSDSTAASQGAESLVELDQESKDWINRKWRPLMAFVYMATCACDFVLFPIMWSILQANEHGAVTSQWQPLTLQGGGLYHMAMGAVLGLTAWGRTKEKIEGKS